MRKLLVLGIVSLFACTASADFYDDFDSYASQAELEAVWTGTLGQLDAGFGNPNQSMFHPGGAQNLHALAEPLTEAAGQPIIWEFDLYDDAIGNKRLACTFDKASWGWLEFGMYNDLVDPDDPGGPNVDGYGMRLLGNGGEGWMSFPGDPTTRTGWHHLKATITADQIVFEGWLAAGLDAGGEPVEAEYVTYTSTSHDSTGLSWDELKYGGPSDLSSPGGGAWIDNLAVYQIPEPATLSLLVLGGLALLRRR